MFEDLLFIPIIAVGVALGEVLKSYLVAALFMLHSKRNRQVNLDLLEKLEASYRAQNDAQNNEDDKAAE